MQVLEVLLPLPLPPFDFLAPFDKELPKVGCRVVVPWQQSVRLGVVSACKTLPVKQVVELREVITVLDEKPFILESAIRLIAELAEYSCTPQGLVLKQFLAVGLEVTLEHKIRSIKGVTDIAIAIDKWLPANECEPTQLDFYRRQGLIEEQVNIIEEKRRVIVPLEFLAEAEKTLSGKKYQNQRRALKVLWELEAVESAAALSRMVGVPVTAVRALVKKGYAGYEDRVAPAPELPSYTTTALTKVNLALPDRKCLSLSGGLRAERLAALVSLLKESIARGESALVLVPESAFLAETVGTFITTLPTKVLSGDLNDKQRLKIWQELEGTPIVLVGTYLALLAPLHKLGRIVVLEHASDSYKLLSASRIFIPTAAQFLANIVGAGLVLSDALETPEVLHALVAEDRFTLPSRPQRIHIADLNCSNNWPLSTDLIRVLRQVAQRKRQAIILTPRRGFSAAFHCTDCGYLAQCPNCDLSLRYHRQHKELRCYQCAHREAVPDLCPNCKGSQLGAARAAGTEWILEAIKKLLPETPIFRFDKDKRDNLTELLEGKFGILVGTTAILRQKLLPNVSLVAHTLLDSHFDIGDFRAAETTYRLLLNLAELAANKRPLVLLQTFKPKHEVLEYFLREDAEGFLSKVLARREKFDYSPFKVLAKVQVSARKEASAENAASFLVAALYTHGAGEKEVLGPVPTPVFRVRGFYHYQLFVRTHNYESLHKLLEPVLSYRGSAKVRVDIDPREMLGVLEF